MTCGVLYDYGAGKSVAIESIEYYDKKFLSFIASAPLYLDDPDETTYYQCTCVTAVKTGRMYIRVYNKRTNSSRLHPGLMVNLYTEDNGGFVHFDSRPTVVARGASISYLTQPLATVEGSINIDNRTLCIMVMQTADRLSRLIALDEDGITWMIEISCHLVDIDENMLCEARIINMETREEHRFDIITIENPYSTNCRGILTLIPKNTKYPSMSYSVIDNDAPDELTFQVKDICLKNEYFHAHVLDSNAHTDFIYGHLEKISGRQFRAYDCEIMGSWCVIPRSLPGVIKIKMSGDKEEINIWVAMKEKFNFLFNE